MKLQDRIAHVAEIIYSDEAMRIFAKNPSWYEDSKPIDLRTPSWTEQRLLLLDSAAHSVRF